MFDLVLGTGNRHKVIELRGMLPAHEFRLVCLADLPAAIDVNETGATFADNACLKAGEQAVNLGRWVLAEDSGLCVDALDGRPGVHSARFAGKHGDDEANNRLLISQMLGVVTGNRGAAFHTHIAVADPTGRIVLQSHGHCRGVIAGEPSGDGGFGYDPLFVIPEYHLTFAQLGIAVKNVLSHRSRALRAILPGLRQLARQHATGGR